MRRILSLCLVLCMLLSFSPVFSAEAEEKEIGYVFYENFDSVITGEYPMSLNQSSKGYPTMTVEEVPSKENKSLKVDVQSTNGIVLDKNNLGKLTEDVVFEFDIRFDNNAAGQIIMAYKTYSGKEANFLSFDRNHNLLLTTGEKIFTLAEGKFYNIIVKVSTITCLADIYVNHKKAASNVLIGGGSIENFSIWRFYCRGVGSGEKPLFYLDNYKVYKSEMPIFKYEDMGIKVVTGEDTSEDYVADKAATLEHMGDNVAMYVGKGKMFSHGGVSQIDKENPDAMPFIENGRTLVPVRAISEGFDAYVNWNENSKTATIIYEETDISIKAGEASFTVNGENKPLDVPAKIKDGRIYVPVRAIVEALGKKVTYDKSGLIVFADKENFWNYKDDLCIFRALAGMLVFNQPSGEEMVKIIKERYPQNGHPRLFATAEDLERIKKECIENKDKEAWLRDCIAGANSYLSQEPLIYRFTGNESHIDADALSSRLFSLATVYGFTGDKKYAKRCIKEMKSAATWTDWNPQNSFLDTATIMASMSFAYDWIYSEMSKSERKTIRKAIVEKGLEHIMQDYQNKPRARKYSWAQSPVPDNWNIVCNAGGIMAAIALADEESTICSQVLDYGFKHVQQAILMYGPDGAWYEGPGYWGYTTRHYVNLMASMDTAFGQDWGYASSPGVSETGYFITSITGPQGTFNFHDAEVSRTNASELFYLAAKMRDGGLSQVRLRQIKDNNYKGNYRDILWYDLSLEGKETDMSKDEYFRDTEVATMRSGYNDSSAIYTALHAGKIAVYHGQMDMGQFIIDAFGTRFASDLGLENYNTPGDNVTKYRYRSEGHNTLVLNPSEKGGQHAKGFARIDRFESGENSAFSITDMTSGYLGQAISVKRGLKLTNNRSVIILQDEVKMPEATDVWWFMHTRQPIEVAEDGKSALITGEHRNMRVSLLQDTEGTFSVMDAQPMETSPKNDAQNKNLLYQKLAFCAKGVKDITIPVMFTFELPIEGMDNNTYYPSVVPLDKWALEETGVKETPYLTSLKINGEEIKGFENDKLSYTYRITADEKMPVAEGEGNGDVSVEYKEGIPGYIVVTISAKEDKNVRTSYVIKLLREVLSTAPGGARELSIKGVWASDVPEEANVPENTLDGDINTRWSAQGKAHITYDLGEICDIGYVGLAIYQDAKRDGRRQYFTVLVSEDGENFTEVYSGETTGTTLEEEIFQIPASKGRYVRIFGKGTSVGEWNSITEAAVYSVK